MADKVHQNMQMSALGAIAVTPSDSADLASPSRGLYIGGGGDVAVIMYDGTTVTFTGMSAGALYPLSVKRVKSIGTTATTIIAVY